MGYTPLHDAALHGFTEIVIQLLEAGADVAACEWGATKRDSLKMARDMKNNDCIRVLRAANDMRQRKDLAELAEVSQRIDTLRTRRGQMRFGHQ